MLNKKIILIEDNTNDVTLTLRAMKKNNISNEIVVLSDGVEALDYIYRRGKYANRNSTEVFALILLDLNLPKVNGLEVLREIRQNEMTKFLPVVVLTTSKEEKDLMESYKLGANSYIHKPVDFYQFSEAINNVSRYWLSLNEIPHSIKN